MRSLPLALIAALVPFSAIAQDQEAPKTDAAQQPPATEPGGAPASAPPVDAGQRFNIKRGLFAEGDLGLFMTFGGRNTNDPLTPSRATSNVQPQLGITVGYDLVHGEAYSFSLGLRLAMGLNGGAGRATAEEAAADPNPVTNPVTTKPSDFSVIEAGLQAAVSFLVTDRLAIAVKADGGAGILDPDPSMPAIHPPPCEEGETPLENDTLCSVKGSGGAKFAPTFGAGVGVEYYTLLNDFSVGITLRFQAILADGMIPAATATIPIKYTF